MCKPDNPLNLAAPPTRVHWVYDDPAGRADVTTRKRRLEPARRPTR